METVKVSAERLRQVWNMPALCGYRYNSDGGYCAAGKIDLLIGYKRWFEVNVFNETIINNTPDCDTVEDVTKKYGNSYSYRFREQGFAVKNMQNFGPENPQWDRHILAFKRMLQKCIAAGLIELEDEAATEFAALSNKKVEEIVNV